MAQRERRADGPHFARAVRVRKPLSELQLSFVTVIGGGGAGRLRTSRPSAGSRSVLFSTRTRFVVVSSPTTRHSAVCVWMPARAGRDFRVCRPNSWSCGGSILARPLRAREQREPHMCPDGACRCHGGNAVVHSRGASSWPAKQRREAHKPFVTSMTSIIMSMIWAPPMMVRMREACPGQSTRVNWTSSYGWSA